MIWLGIAIAFIVLIGIFIYSKFWIGIMFIVLAAVLAGIAYYLWTRINQYALVKKLREEKPQIYRVLAVIYIIALLVAVVLQTVNTMVVLLHLTIFWGIADGIVWMVRKFSAKQWKRYYAGAATLLVTILYLSIGWYNAHHVVETNYTMHTDKKLDGKKLRILQITDMHIGATFNGDGFAEHMKEAERCQPDLVVATGDFVDEETTREDMVKSCKALGSISSTYGVFFVYGNHDEGNYTNSREFQAEEFEKELIKNHITVLKDEAVLINDNFYVIGRKDRSAELHGDRMEMSELVQELDTSKFLLVLDHQPTDYENQKKAGVDLVLSGHTHGGHIFPAGPIGELAKFNCMTYGIRKEGGTVFEVSSGISGWEIPFKTGAISEYVVIDVEPQ